MKKYIGTKQVSATPAWRINGKVYPKDGVVPKAMNREDGYKVVYEDGYESWSPKEVFEKAYKIAETPLNRMQIEAEELVNKIRKLVGFTNNDKFNELDYVTRALLLTQLEAMKEYMALLNLRYTKMGSGDGGIYRVPFSVAITLLENGFAVRRIGWNGKGLFVIKQVPAHIGSDVVPKMQSLPQSAKDLILNGKGFIDYTSQCLIYNENTGRADSWTPSISDVFAKDWEIVL